MALPAGSPVELIAEARRALRQVERLLIDRTPRHIEFCRGSLAEAHSRAERLHDLLMQSDEHAPSLAKTAAHLRAQVAALAERLKSCSVAPF